MTCLRKWWRHWWRQQQEGCVHRWRLGSSNCHDAGLTHASQTLKILGHRRGKLVIHASSCGSCLHTETNNWMAWTRSLSPLPPMMAYIKAVFPSSENSFTCAYAVRKVTSQTITCAITIFMTRSTCLALYGLCLIMWLSIHSSRHQWLHHHVSLHHITCHVYMPGQTIVRGFVCFTCVMYCMMKITYICTCLYERSDRMYVDSRRWRDHVCTCEHSLFRVFVGSNKKSMFGKPL